MMSGYHIDSGSGSSVRLLDARITLHSGPNASRALARPVGRSGSRRLTAWIIRCVMGATTVFALLDLYLLVSSVHH